MFMFLHEPHETFTGSPLRQNAHASSCVFQQACIYQREEDSLWALSVAAHMSSPHQGLPQLRSDVGVTVLLRHHKEMVTACTETFDRFSSTLEVISKYLR